jgi:hypothetical protein
MPTWPTASPSKAQMVELQTASLRSRVRTLHRIDAVRCFKSGSAKAGIGRKALELPPPRTVIKSKAEPKNRADPELWQATYVSLAQD